MATSAFPRRAWPGAVLVVVVLGGCSTPGVVPVQAPVANAPVGAALPADEIDRLVGRIALYPDDLIAIILPAATNPLQIVQADRFLEKRKADPKTPLDESWDDAIKSLLNYPEVVRAMSSDLDWTAALGEAVVADQGDVLEAVQAFRRKTQSAGNLKTDAKQVVVVEKEVIKIVPADPQVIYVPQYNPTAVVVSGGYSAWGYYPSPYPVYYYPYPPGAALVTGLVWGAAISAAWNGGRYATHYGANASININTNISRSAAVAGGATQWTSGKQRGQVSSTVGRTTSARVGDTRAGAGAGAGAGWAGGGGGSRDRADGPTRGGGAFDGYGSGRQTQMDSSRGAASRSAAASNQMRQASAHTGGMRQAPRGGGGRGRR